MLLFLEPRRKSFDVGHQVNALLSGQCLPGGHASGMDAAADGVKKILVSRQRAGWRGPAFEYCFCEVTRPRVEIRCTLTTTISELPVAVLTVTKIHFLARSGITCKPIRMAFLPSRDGHKKKKQGRY